MIIKRWNGSFSTVRTFATTSGSPTINVGDTSGLTPTMTITGTGIPAGTTILSITNASVLVMTQNATATAGTVSLTFAGGFLNQYPRTKAQSIRNNADNANIFDASDKILPDYLPNSVFDSLRYFATVGVNSDIRNLGLAAVANAGSAGRSAIGYYWVATAAVNVGSSTGTIEVNGVYASTSGFNAGEERSPGQQLSANVEVGDWFILTAITGGGTVGSPYSFSFAVVNNTYELMGGAGASSAGYQGLVPGPSSGQNLHFLRGDGTWVIPTDTNTTYTGSTSITLTGTSFSRPALTGDVTASANDNTLTIANDAVTFAKMQNIATANMLGRTTAGTGDIELLTAASVRTFLNVADGATANAGTVISVGGTGSVDGLTLTGTVTSSGNLTLGGALSTSAASITSGTLAVARGGTGQDTYTNGQLLIGNTTGGTLAKATLTQGTGITITNGAGAITVTNASPNATHTGDVTGATALTIANAAVTNAKMANMVQNTIKGRITASTGAPEDLTAANVRTIIELAAPIYIQTTAPIPTVTNSLWYDIN